MRPDDGRVISNFIAQALREQPLTIYGDGTQTRSFCYVDDLIKGIIAMIDSAEAGPVNLGNPDERTVTEIAESSLRSQSHLQSWSIAPCPLTTRRAAGPTSPLPRSASAGAHWWTPKMA